MNRQLLQRYKWVFVVFVLFFFVFIFYVFLGYGYVQVENNQENSAIYVNDLYSQREGKLKLRFGSNKVNISSAEYSTTKNIFVIPFITKNINAKDNKRSFKEEVSAVTNIAPENIDLISPKLFDNRWFVSILKTPNGVNYLVMDLYLGHWHQYYLGNNLGGNYLLLPDYIQSYLHSVDRGGVNGD